jgi:hypothetical protein
MILGAQWYAARCGASRSHRESGALAGDLLACSHARRISTPLYIYQASYTAKFDGGSDRPGQ